MYPVWTLIRAKKMNERKDRLAHNCRKQERQSKCRPFYTHRFSSDLLGKAYNYCLRGINRRSKNSWGAENLQFCVVRCPVG